MKHPLQSSLLILDDDKEILDTMSLVFEDRVKEVILIHKPEQLLATLEKEKPDLLIMDMNYSKGEIDGSQGLLLLQQIRTQNKDIPIIVMTAFGEIELVVKCMKLGVNDFIQKPWSNQRLLMTVSNTLKLVQKESEVVTLRARAEYYEKKESSSSVGMIGYSNAMNLVRDKISKVAISDANVLITGENGTGKELVAEAIHQFSNRNKNPFIKIDLGSVHEQLFESELFGAKKGAYTGLQEDKIGRVTMADSGTLFLDEIGNLSLSMQSKILSVLQNREVFQVGSTMSKQINIRLVSATNLSMNELLDSNVFRQDLLYRINTVEIHIPPLRERKEDIPELFSFFKEYYEKKYNKRHLEVSSDVFPKAREYNWPGNVRELQHAVERAVLMCDNKKIKSFDLLTLRSKYTSRQNERKDFNLDNMEKRLIREVLKIHHGNMTRSAEALGITRAALYRRLEKYGL